MPGMDGWAVLRELKADADISRIPVIINDMPRTCRYFCSQQLGELTESN